MAPTVNDEAGCMRVLGGRVASDARVVAGVVGAQVGDGQGRAERVHLSQDDSTGFGNGLCQLHVVFEPPKPTWEIQYPCNELLELTQNYVSGLFDNLVLVTDVCGSIWLDPKSSGNCVELCNTEKSSRASQREKQVPNLFNQKIWPKD